MNIRDTTEADEPAIHEVHEQAFGPEGEVIADLAVALLHDPTAEPLLSLLAYDGEAPIGHVLFTAVEVTGADEPVRAQILAPLAVLPDRQRQGIGIALVRHGLTSLTESGCELVFVLGHPEYYPRFGFQPAGQHGLLAPHPIPEKNADAWMVMELCEGKLGNVQGKVQCAKMLNEPRHWRE